MSYRAFKRLFGETSLERKCRIWLGIGILSMMTLSFYVFARRTENLVYEQPVNTGRMLVSAVVASLHLESEQNQRAFAEFQKKWEATWTAALKQGLQGLEVQVVQVTSDEAKGLLRHARLFRK